MGVRNAGQQRKVFVVKGAGRPDASQNRLLRTRGAMDIEAQIHQSSDDVLDLFFCRRLLHCNNHLLFPVSGTLPGVCAGREASSSFCNARITSMMRS